MLDNDIEVCSIQRLCLHDGPGIRTSVFLAGCYLHCPWCCNPETIIPNGRYFFNKDKCLHLKGIHSGLCVGCELVEGQTAKTACPFGAGKAVSSIYKGSELVRILEEDKLLYDASGGGVTFSGGEPFLQAETIGSVMRVLKEKHIHVAVETSCYFPHRFLELLKDYIDLYIIDLKLQVGFVRNPFYIEDYATDFLENLHSLQKQTTMNSYRMVYIPEFMDKTEHRKRIVEHLIRLHIPSLQLLPYHKLATIKYQQLNIPIHTFSIPEQEKMETFKRLLGRHKIDCEILTV